MDANVGGQRADNVGDKRLEVSRGMGVWVVRSADRFGGGREVDQGRLESQ